MDNDTLLMKLERIHHISEILYNFLGENPQLQTLVAVIFETSAQSEA